KNTASSTRPPPTKPNNLLTLSDNRPEHHPGGFVLALRRDAMEFHTGRLIDHVHLRARNVANSRYFYETALAVLGIGVTAKGEGWFQIDELFVDAADARTPPTHVHLAFQARDRIGRAHV